MTWEEDNNWILNIVSEAGRVELEFSDNDRMRQVATLICEDLKDQSRFDTIQISFTPVPPGVTQAIQRIGGVVR